MSEASTATQFAAGAVLALASVSVVTSPPRVYEVVPVERRLTFVAPSITNVAVPKVRELREEDFVVLTADDIAMLEAVANARPDDLDYSELLLDDEE